VNSKRVILAPRVDTDTQKSNYKGNAELTLLPFIKIVNTIEALQVRRIIERVTNIQREVAESDGIRC